ncbi:hypothetical protein PHYSODRAFT_328219 [Phytophthora sojae]|uniref:Uncharacterized protein n=1 Tax=Phytophthora sojae (strain P6497) TaxID=1094619 RepID=G4Z331_PHYSP|nr:hypothetical protein PHYSODRAFT_328219 [Phytophthora sojae]EGZ20060.1 hypothetical protein PHYSODRAFT_328219 [Phytophthora sojae]|eukprot:XP_009522777.1 hypothetical protein PHYSODRAFT_328219 [Phytophthora sojae]
MRQGFEVDTRKSCTNHAKLDYDYCCAAHDPSIRLIRPHVLDPIAPGLRARVEDDVVARNGGKDIYNRKALNLRSPLLEKPRALQLDELRREDDFLLATDFLRDNVVNELDNLALTRSSTNCIKGRAVWKFLGDSLTGHRDNTTFTSYLLDAKRDDETLGRDATRRITRYMGQAIKKCQRTLADEDDTPVLEQLSERVQRLRVDMKLGRAR